MRILHNAQIHTLDPTTPQASALAIDDHAPHAGRILAAGDDDHIMAEFGGRAAVENMDGAVILPGLTDAHLHLRYYALGLRKIDLFGADMGECLARVAGRAAETPTGTWIQGHGWNQNDWPGGFPSATELDAAAPTHPVYLTAASLHAAWANSAALKAAEIGPNTPDPKNGEIQRGSEGQASGILFEEAMKLVSRVIPDPDEEDTLAMLEQAQQALWRMGLTGVHDFDRIKAFAALQTLHGRGGLKLRVLKNLPVERLDAIIESGLRSGFGDDLLRIGGIKVFADGALGPHTAAMLDPYEGEPDNRGMLFLDGEELFEQGRKAALGGLSMTVHAIGDAANHEVLRGYEILRKFEAENHLPRRRHRIEHVQALHPDDVGRLADLGLVASMQPIHATADMQMADAAWGARARHSYAWRSLLEKGATLAFGSDAPVDTPNPFHGLHAAITRRRADGSPGPEGWYPEQRLTLAEALRAYTSGAAYAAGMEDRLGRLAPGCLADLIVLERDPFEIEPEALRELAPTAVMVGGDWVWGR